MATSSARHRVIGIRHTLKHLKNAGLIEQDTLYPHVAVQDVQAELLGVAERWYKIGARRGALEILEAFLDGHLEVKVSKTGKREIVTNKEAVAWSKKLKVTAGATKKQIAQKTYELTVKELGFK